MNFRFPDDNENLKYYEYLKEQSEEICNQTRKMKRQLFELFYIALPEIKPRIGKLTIRMGNIIFFNNELRIFFDPRELLNKELDWRIPHIFLPSPLWTERPSLKVLVLAQDFKENKEQYDKSPQESYFWRKDMLVAENKDDLREIGYFMECFDKILVNLNNHNHVIHTNGGFLIPKMEMIYSSYKLPWEHVNQFILARDAIAPVLENLQNRCTSISTKLVDAETQVDGLQQYTSRRDERRGLDNHLPINAWSAFEFQALQNSLDQFQKIKPDSDAMLATMLDLVNKMNTLNNSISRIETDINPNY